MKITFVSPPPDLSGGIRVIALHAARLHRMGHQVTVVAPAPPRPSLRSRLRATLHPTPAAAPLTRTP